MSDSLNVLIVEDSEDDALLVLRELRSGDFDPIWERVETPKALGKALTSRPWDVIISDYRLPAFNASVVLKIVQQSQLDIPFIVVSGTIGETLAVEMMKAGAHDYLMKDNLSRLSEAVRREVRDAQIRAERERATLELDRTKERLQLAIEGSGIGLWDWSIQTGAMTLNERWAEMVGYTLEELEPIGIETWRKYIHPQDWQTLNIALEEHFQHKTQVYECELRMNHRSGYWIWVLARGKVVEWDATGQPLRMTGTHLDLTERKRAEVALQRLNRELEDRVQWRTAALQQSEHRLREAQQVARLGSWELDIVTKQLTWSAEVFRIFGLDPDRPEPTYEELFYYFPHDERIRFKQLVDRAIHFAEPYETDFQILRADGSCGYIFAKGQLGYTPEGEVNRLFGIAMDISDRKQVEATLQKTNAELARATRLKDEFLASMSHELRTPIAAILGMSDVLKEEIFGELNQKQRHYIDVISQSGNHLLSLINDILDLAKIESGKLELQLEPILVPILCSSSLSFVKQMAHNKNIKLATRLFPSDIGEINVDRLRIEQALINLLSNAVKFTPAGGQVVLEVKQDLERAVIYFSVSDTGIGIAPEDMPKLFESFVQIDSSLNRQYNGTGLGLALVKQIVELHKGSVKVESTLGQGSCFTIELANCFVGARSASQSHPIESSSTPVNQALPQLQNSSALILLAEDNQTNIDTFSEYLTHAGYTMLIAMNGLEAIDLAALHQPDLILMDIQMPGMDGLEATRQIRTFPELVNTPIIALTALAMSGDRERCLAAGANEYLTKPLKLRKLTETIEKLLAARKE